MRTLENLEVLQICVLGINAELDSRHWYILKYAIEYLTICCTMVESVSLIVCACPVVGIHTLFHTAPPWSYSATTDCWAMPPALALLYMSVYPELLYSNEWSKTHLDSPILVYDTVPPPVLYTCRSRCNTDTRRRSRWYSTRICK